MLPVRLQVSAGFVGSLPADAVWFTTALVARFASSVGSRCPQASPVCRSPVWYGSTLIAELVPDTRSVSSVTYWYSVAHHRISCQVGPWCPQASLRLLPTSAVWSTVALVIELVPQIPISPTGALWLIAVLVARLVPCTHRLRWNRFPHSKIRLHKEVVLIY